MRCCRALLFIVHAGKIAERRVVFPFTCTRVMDKETPIVTSEYDRLCIDRVSRKRDKNLLIQIRSEWMTSIFVRNKTRIQCVSVILAMLRVKINRR